jgi:hypothetical protein
MHASRSVPFLLLLGALGCQYIPDAHPPGSQPPQSLPSPAYGYPPPYGAYYPPPTVPMGAPPPGAPTQTVYQPPPAPTAPLPGPAAPAPGAPVPASNRPLLGALVGSLVWQAEARAVLAELESNLTAEQQRLVAGVPIVFDPSPNEVNAFAACDDSGAPFVAGTEGLLEAMDAIAQTRATDELYATHTYDAYTAAVLPQLASSTTASAALPAGVLPSQAWVDPRRVSRAHEIFDEILAFTFGHELAHHYRGHTGCAHGQPSGIPPAASDIRRMASMAIPLVNQLNENEADQWGCFDVLATGKARASRAYRWTEEGGLFLFDFFARLDGAAGANPLVGFLRTHPAPGLRIPQVQFWAATWRFQNPG